MSLPKAIATVPLAAGRAANAERAVCRPPDGRDAGRLSPRTVAYVHTILHRAFRDAVRWNLIVRNPADHADPPRGRPSERVRARTWTGEEIARFLDATADSRYSPLWRLIATTGMRRGEALGLRWDDVDLYEGRLSVNRTLVQAGDYHSGDTGRRVGHSEDGPRAASDLTGPRNQWPRCGHIARVSIRKGSSRDPDIGDQGLVFCSRLGDPMHPKVVSNQFRKAVARHAMPYLSVHGLRHSWATLALQAGIHPKIVQERLGHSTISITLDIYSHVNPAMDADAANTVAALDSRPLSHPRRRRQMIVLVRARPSRFAGVSVTTSVTTRCFGPRDSNARCL